jgi:hypothetical protein
MVRKTTTSAIGDRPRKRVASQQMDLFRGALAETSARGPAWPDLPEGARDALVGLMTQLILEHARVNAMQSAAAEASHDR